MCVDGLVIFMYSKYCIVLVKCKMKKSKKNPQKSKKTPKKPKKDSRGVVMNSMTTLAGAFTRRELLVRMLNL